MEQIHPIHVAALEEARRAARLRATAPRAADSDARIREMAQSDGEAFSALSRECPDTGVVRATARYHVEPAAAFEALRPRTAGFLAEASCGDLAGSAFVSFTACRFGEEARPAALLHTLMVHPAHRGRGLARKLVRAAVEHARGRLGPGGVVFAHVPQGNTGSLRAIGASLPRLGGELAGHAVRLRMRPPRGVSDWAVRLLHPDEAPAFVSARDAFYAGYDLYPREDAAAFRERLDRSPTAAPLRRAFVVADRRDRLLAGLTVVEQSLLCTLEVERAPSLMRLAGRLLRVPPPEQALRQIAVEDAWFAPGGERAARHLWETVRWEMRHRGQVLVCTFDRKSPVRALFGVPRWAPRTTTALLHDGEARGPSFALLYPFV